MDPAYGPRMRRVILLALSTAAGAGLCIYGQGIVEREIRIPTRDSLPRGLAGVLLRPEEPGLHPLVILNHGASRDANSRPTMHPYSTWFQAVEFARRGFTAAIVMRRGYGDSGGKFAESYGGCNHADYTQAGENAATDLREAIEHLVTLPGIDPHRVLSVGVSAGGFATVALTAHPPPQGLVAAISFAGGRGSTSADTVCDPDAEVAAFQNFGKSSRVPMLWIYAANDHFFGPQLAQRFYKAFTDAGGRARFLAAQPFGSDGHGLFSRDGIPIWTPMVDEFLASQHLTLRSSLLPFPAGKLPPSPGLKKSEEPEFEKYLHAAPHKAWAIREGGGWAWVSTRASEEQAENDARQNCQKPNQPACTIYAIDNRLRR